MLSKLEMETLKEIEALARGGDAASQYRLAALLEQSGQREEARAWTRKAADAGHPGALYTLACDLLSMLPADMDIDEAIVLLTRAAQNGGAAAKRQLAVLTALGFGVEQSWDEAVTLLGEAAKAGHPPAMRELALLAESASGRRWAGGRLLGEAARKGDWVALVYAARRPGVLGDAEAAMARASLRQQGVGFVALDPQAEDRMASPAVSIDDLISAAKKIPEPGWRRLSRHERPAIGGISSLLTRDECDYVICTAAPLLTPSLVVDPEKGAADHAQYRTSDGALISLLDLDLMLISIYRRLAMAAEVDWGNCELIGVLRYRPGQEYKPHHDYLPEDEKDYSEVRRAGQRWKTLLVYLNDAYAGGATVFPDLKLDHKGRTGDAFIFENTDGAGGAHPETLHAGAPVTKGEKWLLSLWCREKRFWFWG